MNYSEISEIVTGLVLRNKLAPGSVDTDKLMAPYDAVIKSYKDGSVELSDLVAKHGVSPIQASIQAADAVKDVKADWLYVLSETHIRTSAGESLASIAKKLQRGEEVDQARLRNIVGALTQGTKTGRKKLSEINELDDPLIPIGWKPWDDHIGGMPKSGLVVIGGHPGVGKTSLVADICGSFAETYLDKSALVYSLEMTGPEFKERWLLANPDMDKSVQDRIEVNDLPLNVQEVITDAAMVENVGIVFVDFADLLVRGEVSEAQMGNIYVTLSLGAKELGCPVVLLSQLNRSYHGGIPRPCHIRYTGLAEALASQLVMLYNPAVDFYEDESNQLLTNKKLAYIIFWKVRAGFRVPMSDGKKREGPGAIGMVFGGERGWVGEKSKWFSMKGVTS